MNLVTAFFPILTVIIGGVCILLIVSTKTLRDSRDDLEHRVEQLEGERTRDKETIASQETAVKFWRSAATGDDKLDDIGKQLAQHHVEAVQNWIAMKAALGHVGRVLESVDEHLVQIIANGGTTT